MTLILAGIRDAAAARAAKHRPAVPVVLVLWSYLQRLSARFDRLLARVEAGRLTKPRLRHARAISSPRAHKQLPRSRAWLLRLVPGIAAYGSQLQYLLDDPEMKKLLAVAPQLARMLRPLRRMLGHPPDAPLAPDMARPRPKRPDTAETRRTSDTPALAGPSDRLATA